jgi:hypothetical protein
LASTSYNIVVGFGAVVVAVVGVGGGGDGAGAVDDIGWITC